MLSVIVPTKWENEYFIDFLERLLESEVVGEVIIINNDVSNTPESEVLVDEKVRLYNTEKNLYVVPAWNVGIEMSHYDKVCIMSDCIEFDLQLLTKADNFLKPEIGMLGVLTPEGTDNTYINNFTDGEIDFVPSMRSDPTTRPAPVGMHRLFFVNKSDYTHIPVVKIFHGATMLWKRIETAKENYIVTNCEVDVVFEKEDTSDEFANIQKEDREAAYGPNKVRY
jgi:hypothetical protein